jgi:hypothetical protein
VFAYWINAVRKMSEGRSIVRSFCRDIAMAAPIYGLCDSPSIRRATGPRGMTV